MSYGAWEDVERLVAERQDRGWEQDEPINYHTDGCFGCGPLNTSGLGLRWVAGAQQRAVTCTARFTARFMGWHGILHGGAVAAVLDDALGAAMVRNLSPAMTTRLQVSFLAPVLLDVDSEIHAAVITHRGNEIVATASISQSGRRLAEAEGVFKQIKAERLLTYRGPQGGRGRRIG